MQAEKTNTILNYILPGLLISAAFTAVIGLTAVKAAAN